MTCSFCRDGVEKDPSDVYRIGRGTLGLCRTCARRIRARHAFIEDADLESKLPAILRRAAADANDLSGAIAAGNALSRLDRIEEACAHWRRAGYRMLEVQEYIGAFSMFGQVLHRTHPGLAADHEAHGRAAEGIGSKEMAMVSFARAAELREAEAGGATSTGELKAKIAELKPQAKAEAPANAEARRKFKPSIDAMRAEIDRMKAGTAEPVLCDVCGELRERSIISAHTDHTKPGAPVRTNVCHVCCDTAIATLRVPDAREVLLGVIAAIEKVAGATLHKELEGVPWWVRLDRRPGRATFHDGEMNEPRPERDAVKAVLATETEPPRVRALAALWLGTCRNPEDIEALEALIDSTDSAGKFPGAKTPNPGTGLFAKPEDPLLWESCTVGEAALSALALVHARLHASAADYRAWRKACAE